jgi:hypothetical protein
MPADTYNSFSLSEIELARNTILSKTVLNRDDVIPLDRIEFPTAKWLMSLGNRKTGLNPVDDGYRVLVKGLRGQGYQWWSGDDLLPFTPNTPPIGSLQYSVGKGHYGTEWLIHKLEKHGIYIDYSYTGQEVRKVPGRGSKLEVLCNILAENEDDCGYDKALDMAKRMFSSNVAMPKCFTGLNGLFSFTSNTTGEIGGQSQSNQIFRHQLITGSTVDTILTDIYHMVQRIERLGGNVDYVACGDTIFDLLINMMHNTATGGGQTGAVNGKVDFIKNRFAKLTSGETFNVALPQNSLAYNNIPIVNDSLFSRLAAEEPSVSWDKAMIFFDKRHLFPLFPRQGTVVTHPMPAEQRVLKTSYHDEAVLICTNPQRFGVIMSA